MTFDKTSNPQYSEFIALSRYARWNEAENRRETWAEVCDRVADFWIKREPDQEVIIRECFEAQKDLRVMGSMRANMTAGPALERDHVAGYNCSYTTMSGNGEQLVLEHELLDAPVVVHLKNPIDFDEMMYILMCGTGSGYSVERQYINNLPKVGKPLNRRSYENTDENYPGVDPTDLSIMDKKNNTIIVADTKYGWASAMRILIFELYNANFKIDWDVSLLRGAGAKLNTFGGRASGPEPLVELFEFSRNIFTNAYGRKLSSIECHDLCCKIANIVVVGGVRRSALISLSNPTDERLRVAKTGQWHHDNPQRGLANNSAAYTEKPDFAFFLKEWMALYESKSGERGMFSRVASQKKAAENGRRDASYEFGTNPCCEIILRPKGFCNLTEVVVRNEDTLNTLKEKVRLATIIGTFQSTLVDFKYLSPEWKKNAEEERLLGVSLTGIMDNEVMSGAMGEEILVSYLAEMKQVAIETNKHWAERLGIEQSAAITCVKPSGTVSQLVDSASGIHPRFARHYIRRVRGDIKDPLTEFMMDHIPWEMDSYTPGMVVFEFPQKAPENAVLVEEVGAIKQLELWKIYYDEWCEHKPSITVYYRDNEEFMKVGAWLYENFDECSGVSFLPVAEHSYVQAPYEEISEVVYDAMKEMEPIFDWDGLTDYEEIDNTKGAQELACSGNVCEIVDV
jgi:ribonucleoside-triphosphate reductase